MNRPMKSAYKFTRSLVTAAVLAIASGCVAPKPGPLPSAVAPLPDRFPGTEGTTNAVVIGWREYFQDPVLISLISTALTNNQELNILMQEVAVAKAETDARRGALFPFLRLGGTAGVDKVSVNSRNGAVEENLEIQPGKKFPDPLPTYGVAADLDWEIDIWKKLRNERDAAIQRYLATQEGRNFMVTHLVAEIAETYYDLLSLDGQLAIYRRMLEMQEKALESVRIKKTAARVTELAVRRFEAEVSKNRSKLFAIQQQIIENENRLNVLTGRYPQSIDRSPDGFEIRMLSPLQAGVPSELLRHRPDVRQAELELKAAGLEVKVAAARFYPAMNVSAVLGIESFTMGSPILAKENLAYGATANLVGPLINRSAIKAAFKGASARQVAAVYRYQQTVLKAYVEVVNALSQVRNVGQGYELKSRQVEALSDAATMSSQLFNSARADYTEVLLTQREALESRVELVEMKQIQLMATVKAYKALGGGVPDSRDYSATTPKATVKANGRPKS
jgi:multidrug efflux system outer membrane protein